MLVINDLGFDIMYRKSLANKPTARCPEQFIGSDQEGNLYLVVYAKTDVQAFYSQRAVLLQQELAAMMPRGMEINTPIYNGKKEDGWYTVYRYFEDLSETRNSAAEIWIKKVYNECSHRYQVTEDVVRKIEEDFLSAWPEQYHARIMKLDNFKKLHDSLVELKQIDICFQHGDYTPNNILNKNGETTYLMDFEFSVKFQPIGFDLFDYHFSTDKKFGSVPNLKINQIKEELINEINQIIDADYQANVCDHAEHTLVKRSWADNMIYNRPDLFDPEHTEETFIKYGKDYYNVKYSVRGYKAVLHAWLRPLPAAVMDQAVRHILQSKKKVQKIEVDYASANTSCGDMTPDNNWVIFLPDTTEELLGRLNKKGRYNLQREKRLLAENYKGDLVITKYDSELPENIIQQHFRWKEKTHGTQYHMTAHEYLKRYHVNGGMSLAVGGQVISVLFYCINAETVYLENLSYDTEFGKYSPGFILYELFLEEMINRKVKVIFLGNGKQSYKQRFGSMEYQVFTGSVYRNRFVKWLNELKRKVFS